MPDNELTVEEIGEIEELAHAGGSPRPEFVLMLCDMARRYATEVPHLISRVKTEQRVVSELEDQRHELRGRIAELEQRLAERKEVSDG